MWPLLLLLLLLPPMLLCVTIMCMGHVDLGDIMLVLTSDCAVMTVVVVVRLVVLLLPLQQPLLLALIFQTAVGWVLVVLWQVGLMLHQN
jgi:hypothetical protein